MTKHAISDAFMDQFLSETGKHNQILSYVQNDDTLDMELRGNYVSIYYRGGKILKINEDGKIETLDKKYLTGESSLPDPAKESDKYFPEAKHQIDVYVRKKRNHLGEKEIQQLVVKENNYSCNSSDTDYFVIDMEYEGKKGRFDLVALRWDATSSERQAKSLFVPTLTVIEVKQGYETIGGGESSLSQHYKDFSNFMDETDKKEFKEDMLMVFRQKRRLGLIDDFELDDKLAGHYKDVTQCSQDIKFVALLANYKEKSTALKEELKKIGSCDVFRSHYMGYGLYESKIEKLTSTSL
ncbi:hypothetical protein FACS1894199_08460 [Bacteroidia bacterium]|nr:hypothetical protein FACS1894199_08460 [Bacteroidia bacterium]